MDNFLGEVRLAGFGVVPKGWAICNGALLPVAQNQALFSLLGTTYGGNGITTFGLPDLRSRIPVGYGSSTPLGQVAGSEQVTLTLAELPAHAHSGITGTVVTSEEAVETNPGGKYLAPSSNQQFGAGATGTLAAAAVPLTVENTGSSQPHENRQPYQAINYLIALQGIYPSRS